MRRRLSSTTVVAVLVLAACSSERAPSTGDRAFVGDLLPHHHLGMALVDEATTRSADVRLRRLVFEMGSYHGREAALLQRWTDDWGLDDAADFPGHVSTTDLERLAALSGTAHDIWWLHLMIQHHEGALVIARSAVGSAGLSEVDDMAATVERVQSAELVAMNDLLAELCGESPSAGCPASP